MNHNWLVTFFVFFLLCFDDGMWKIFYLGLRVSSQLSWDSLSLFRLWKKDGTFFIWTRSFDISTYWNLWDISNLSKRVSQFGFNFLYIWGVLWSSNQYQCNVILWKKWGCPLGMYREGRVVHIECLIRTYIRTVSFIFVGVCNFPHILFSTYNVWLCWEPFVDKNYIYIWENCCSLKSHRPW